MNKYFRAVICLIATNLKFICLKLIHGKCFQASLLNVCSPMTNFEIRRGGKLFIGKKFKTRSNSHIKVRKNGVIELGENVSLNYGDIIVCHEKIKIGNNVQLSPNVLIYDHDHNFRIKDGLKKLLYKTSPIEIGNNVWIGANTVILRGTKIGDNCVIGAGCVIKGNCPENTVIVQKRSTEFRSL